MGNIKSRNSRTTWHFWCWGSLESAITNLNAPIKRFVQCTTDLGLTFSIAKSVPLVVNSKKLFQGPSRLQLKIPTSQTTSFWPCQPHIKFIAEKCEKGLSVLRCMAKIKYCPHPQICPATYKALVQFVLSMVFLFSFLMRTKHN